MAARNTEVGPPGTTPDRPSSLDRSSSHRDSGAQAEARSGGGCQSDNWSAWVRRGAQWCPLEPPRRPRVRGRYRRPVASRALRVSSSDIPVERRFLTELLGRKDPIRRAARVAGFDGALALFRGGAGGPWSPAGAQYELRRPVRTPGRQTEASLMLHLFEDTTPGSGCRASAPGGAATRAAGFGAR